MPAPPPPPPRAPAPPPPAKGEAALPGAFPAPVSPPEGRRPQTGPAAAPMAPAPATHTPPKVSLSATSLLDAAPTRLNLVGMPQRPAEALSPREAAEVRVDSARTLVDACRAELEKKPDVHRAARLHYEIARQYEGPLGDLDRALEHYQLAFQLHPDHVPTVRGARRVCVAQKKYAKALPLYDAEARLTSDPHQKAMLLYEKGVVLEDLMGQRREARQAFTAALDLDESNPTILKALERADIASSAWDELDRTWERASNAVSSDVRHRAALIAERARLLEVKRGDPEQAIELYRTALSVDPQAPGSVPALKSLLYRHKRWRDLISVLEHEAQETSDPNVRAMARYRVGRIQWDHLGSLDEAISAFEAASTEAPDDVMILEELSRAYELSKRWDSLAKTLERLTEKTLSSDQRVGAQHRIGQIYEERLGNAASALEWYRSALETDAAYLPALQALGTLYTESAQWTALVAMHLGEAGATTDTARRAAAHARVAEILERQLGNIDQAIEHHARALGLVAGYPPSFKALARIYAEGKRYRELVELYERAVDLAKTDDAKIAYLFKIGRLHEDALGTPQAAVVAYRRVLGVNDRHLGAIHAVQRAAERAELWPDLVQALEYEAERVTDKSERVALLHRAGEVLEEKLNDVDGAIERYKKVLEVDGRYAPALSSLGRLYYKAGRWDDLLGVYRLELRIAPKGPEPAALLYKMGELCEDRIGREAEALDWYRQAIEADPKHQPARHALVRLLSARSNWKEVVRLLEIELGKQENPAERARTAFRVGEVYEHRLTMPDKALAAYEKALSDAPELRPALEARARLLEQAKSHKALAEALAREADNTPDPMIAISARMREGEVWRDQLDDAARATEAFEAVLARDPNHLGALLALEPLYTQLSNWDKLVQNYAAQARILQNGFARVAVLREQARLQEAKQLESIEDLTQTYLSVVRMAPTDVSALSTLERFGLDRKDWGLLSHVDAKLGALAENAALAAAYQTRLGESLEATGDASALDTYRAALARDPDNLGAAKGLARLADRSGDPALLADSAMYTARVLKDLDGAAALFVKSAAIRVEQSDLKGAAADLERALEVHPDHAEAAQRLAERLLGANDLSRLLDVLSRAAQAAKSRERRAALWVAVGELYADRSRDLGAALAALGRALKEVPRHVPALMKQAELLVRDAQWHEAAQRLKEAIAAGPPQELLIAAQLQLALALDKHLNDPKGAEACVRAVLELEPNQRGALEVLLDVQLRRDQLEAASDTAARLVAASPLANERAEALTRLAQLERKRGARAKAAEAYQQALTLAGQESSAAEDFKSLLAEQKQHGEPPSYRAYAQGLAAYLERVKNPEPTLAPLYIELGRVLDDELKQTDQGLGTLRRGLSLVGEDPALRTELARRLRRAGRHAEAADELRRLLELDTLRAETWAELVDVLRQLGKHDLAAVALEPLVAVGGGTDLDRVTVQSRAMRPASAAEGSFDGGALRLVDAGLPEDAPTTVLLESLSPGLNNVYPAEVESYGLSSRDRISSRSGHPFRMLADRVARIFGVGDFDLYIHQAHAGGLEVEFGDYPSVMVPAQVTALPESQQVFLLARVLVNVARGLYAVDKLAPHAISALLTAATRSMDPAFGSGAGDDELLDGLAKRIYKGLPRRSRRAFEDAARAYGPAPKPRLDEWMQRVRMTAARAAVIVSDDLSGAVALMRRTEGDLSRLDSSKHKRGMALVGDVMRFAVSDSAVSLRRRLGMT